MEVKGVKIEFLGHAGFLIKNSKTIIIDPFNTTTTEKADIILITHSHYDHCSIKDLEKVAKKDTIVIGPADVQSAVMKLKDIHLQPIESGDEIELGKIKIQAVPAYNIKKEFHKKNEGWLGYVIKFGSTIIYHSGDSDFTPEMAKLSGYGKHGNDFIALLPVSGKYVMDAKEAAEAATALKPHIAIPMHYGSIIGSKEDAETFTKLCKEKGIKAQILDKI